MFVAGAAEGLVRDQWGRLPVFSWVLVVMGGTHEFRS